MIFIAGSAYLLDCTYIRPEPKKKYAICICSEKPLFFFINSEPRKHYEQKSQVYTDHNECSFLKHESYVNTADTVTCIQPLTCRVVVEFGDIPKDLKNRIKNAVADSETLPQRFIDTVIKNL